MFDLNEKKFNGTVIFNNGNGGLVKDVTIEIEKKKQEDPDTYPAYKLIITDDAGGKINQGFYYPTSQSEKSNEDNEKRAVREVARIVHLAKSVVGTDYKFPQVSSAKEAFDTLFTIIKDNIKDQKFNVFTTYGTHDYPSKYMGLRYFDFIENATTVNSRLKVKPGDALERMEQDSEIQIKSDSATSQSWV